MNDQEIRIELLNMANRFQVSPCQAVDLANQYYEFVHGRDKKKLTPAKSKRKS